MLTAAKAAMPRGEQHGYGDKEHNRADDTTFFKLFTRFFFLEVFFQDVSLQRLCCSRLLQPLPSPPQFTAQKKTCHIFTSVPSQDF